MNEEKRKRGEWQMSGREKLNCGQITGMIFRDQEHKEFYQEYLEKCRWQDVYHQALIYCIGISEDTRKNIEQIYDLDKGCVKTECLRKGWQTSDSLRIVRMAFALYCSGAPSVYDYDDEEERLQEYAGYTVGELFCCGYAEYFWQAVKIRYPEYCS